MDPVPTLRVLLGMTLGALVATLGALFLGEYEFDELLPILSGALLGLIVAEVVVSVGRVRNIAVALSAAAWSATAVVLAGILDANETGPIKWGAYLSAGLAGLAALARANKWRQDKTETGDDDETDLVDADGPRDLEVAATAPPQPRRRHTPAPVPVRVEADDAPRITVTTRRRPRTDRDR